MVLHIYNSLTRKKEPFTSVREDYVRMYNCGPTVYSYVHIGNLRSFLVADLLRRFLEFKRKKVLQVMNITDVGHMFHDEDVGEDKMEAAAKKEGKDPKEIAKFYTEKFFEDIDNVNIQHAEYYPKATDHVKEIILLIEALIKNGHVYEADDGLYYDISTFKDYGKLSGNTIEQLQAGKRVEARESKKSPYDFALWIKDPRHIMQWESPFGKGYPGWHIECSAMSMKYLSEAFEHGKFEPQLFETIDIHTGGEDNKFPHHECEIAQSEGATKKQFIKYWLHVKHLIVNGEKMSKSLGNFYTLRDVLDKGHDALAVRLQLISTHYRQQLNFTFEGVTEAKQTIERFRDFMARLKDCKEGDLNPKVEGICASAASKFEEALDDDLNVSAALAAVFDLMHDINKLELSAKDAALAYDTMLRFDSVLGLDLEPKEEEISDEAKKLITQREDARLKKDWKRSDELRDKLKALGIEVKDTKDGVKWKKIS
ncbi:MAG: cysteine--tRNA ligase [Candidatus Woesearchaeota archaeon]